MNKERLQQNLEKRGFAFSYFKTKEEAVRYLSEKIHDTTVGIGGSKTVHETGLYDALTKRNDVAWHMVEKGAIERANRAEVYISSLNGIAETGELINIDGVGNRVSATAYGAPYVYFVVGANKVRPDFEQALWRARNIAGVKNARRFNVNTPCVTQEERCYDCMSPERICRELLVLWQKPVPVKEMEIILIEETLGY